MLSADEDFQLVFKMCSKYVRIYLFIYLFLHYFTGEAQECQKCTMEICCTWAITSVSYLLIIHQMPKPSYIKGGNSETCYIEPADSWVPDGCQVILTSFRLHF